MHDSDPQYLESQFLAAQAILEHLKDEDVSLSERLSAIKDEALELVSHVMRNGTLPVRS